MQSRRQVISKVTCGVTALSGFLPGIALSQTWPSKPVTLVVGFPPGGAPDVVARSIAEALAGSLGQSVIVDTKTGAAGTIAAAQVARAAPDGYTLLMALAANMSSGPHLMPSAKYDPVTAFAPIGFIQRSAYYLIVGSGSRFKDVASLMAEARKTPGEVSLGVPGLGTPHHLVAELLMKSAGVKMNLIPYTGTPQGVNELLGGRLDVYLDLASSAVDSQAKAGKLRYLAMSGGRRASTQTSVPTLVEAGITGVEAYSWFGLVAPANTPPDVVRRLSSALGIALKSTAVRERLLNEGIPEEGIASGSPEELKAWIATEFARWGRIIKDSNIKL